MAATNETLTALDDTVLVVSPGFFVERLEGNAATVCLRSTGSRLKIPRPLLDVLLRFRAPASLDALAAHEPSLARAAGAVATLRSKGFLVTPAEAQRPSARRVLTDPPVRLFDCPAHRMVPAEADVVVFGMPWDGGDIGACGARNAPLAIRDASLQILYGVDRFSGRPLGWYDADRARPLLAGMTIGDCGDVFVDHGEPQSALHARFSDALRTVLDAKTLPVVIGGDASVCVPLVECLQAHAPLAVLRIGGPPQHPSTTAGNFVDASALACRFGAMPGVAASVFVVQGRAVAEPAPGARTLDPLAFRARGVEALLALLPPALPVYVGIDASILRQPGGGDEDDGLDYGEIRDVLWDLGACRRIAGLDLVGLVPTHPAWNAMAMTALHVLVAAMSAARDARQEGAMR